MQSYTTALPITRLDVAEMILHHTPHDSQTESCSAPSQDLPGIEGLEDPFPVLCRQTGPLVRNAEHRIVTGFHIIIVVYRRCNIAVCGRYGDDASIRHG